VGRVFTRITAGLLGGALAVLAVPAHLSAAAPLPEPAVSGAAAKGCATTLSVVAHQDDDLLFVNPDISADIAGKRCMVTVFATAGDAGKGRVYWRGREKGAMAAYASMAGAASNWVSDTVMVNGVSLTKVSLVGRPISLIFMRLPDGHGYAMHNFEAMHNLYKGSQSTIHAIDGSAVYTRASLTATLAALMDTYRPDVIRTLDYVGAYGDGDHGDHHSAAYFTLAAHEAYAAPHRLFGYQGYAAVKKPVNLSGAVRDTKMRHFMAYGDHDDHVCRTRRTCLADVVYAPRFSHRYLTGVQVGGAGNVAAAAVVTASSDDTVGHRPAVNAVDRAPIGFTAAPGSEWATSGGRTGSWIKLGWPAAQRLASIVLHDRPNTRDRVTAGTLTFSDGSTVEVGALPDEGAALVVRFAPRTVTGVRFTVTGVSTSTRNVGLAELQAFTH
jgi:LmbE family N-acetylglucosaminyl deacetylase